MSAPRRCRRVLAEGLNAAMVPLSGSVELAARLGLAEAAVDLVETGRTLRENRVQPVEERLAVSPYLIARRAAFFWKGDELRAWRRRLGGLE